MAAARKGSRFFLLCAFEQLVANNLENPKEMTLKEFTQRIAWLNVYQAREVSDDYQERVILNVDIKQWSVALEEVLGPPVKPAGADPSGTDIVLCQIYGSIMKNQTLYRKTFGDGTILAMLWPWQDGTHTTLKIGRVSPKVE